MHRQAQAKVTPCGDKTYQYPPLLFCTLRVNIPSRHGVTCGQHGAHAGIRHAKWHSHATDGVAKDIGARRSQHAVATCTDTVLAYGDHARHTNE